MPIAILSKYLPRKLICNVLKTDQDYLVIYNHRFKICSNSGQTELDIEKKPTTLWNKNIPRDDPGTVISQLKSPRLKL